MDQPTRILVVDDDPALRAATLRLVRVAGYTATEAENGLQGLAQAQSQLPDMVLLDVDMPDLSGLEVCQRIKADPGLAHTFVVLVSASQITSDQQSLGLEGGADGYIARPIANRELLARVQAFARIQRTEAELRRSRAQLQRTLEERESLIAQLQAALREVKTLSGLIPICANCKKIRDDRGYWNQVESYIGRHSTAQFSHGLCPECIPRYFPDPPAEPATQPPPPP